MIYLLIALIAIGIFAAIAGIIRHYWLRYQLNKGNIDALPTSTPIDAECCGAHQVCEKESLLAGASKEIEYFDDYELDLFVNIQSDSYTSDQVAQFAEILYTIIPYELPAWVRSLQLRNIQLPDQLKDELFLLLNDKKNH